MNTITIKVNIDNDAFQDRLSEELQSVLNAPQIVNRLCGDECVGEPPRIPLFDANGNKCGHASVSQEDWK